MQFYEPTNNILNILFPTDNQHFNNKNAECQDIGSYFFTSVLSRQLMLPKIYSSISDNPLDGLSNSLVHIGVNYFVGDHREYPTKHLYYKVLNALKNHGLVIATKGYKQGETTKQYRLSDELFYGGWKLKTLSTDNIPNSIQEYMKNKKKGDRTRALPPVLERIQDDMRKVSVRNYGAGIDNVFMLGLDRIKNGEAHVCYPKTKGGRVYHQFLNTPKKYLTKLIHYNGHQLAEIDSSNCQLLITASIIQKQLDFFIKYELMGKPKTVSLKKLKLYKRVTQTNREIYNNITQEHKKYKKEKNTPSMFLILILKELTYFTKLCKNGKIYDFLADKISEDQWEKIQKRNRRAHEKNPKKCPLLKTKRQYVKARIFGSILFGKPYFRSGIVYEIFCTYFPLLFEVIADWKEEFGYKELPKLNQVLESEIFVWGAAAELQKDPKIAIVIPRHDSHVVVANEYDIRRSQEEITIASNRVIGMPLFLKCEIWGKPQAHNLQPAGDISPTNRKEIEWWK